MDKKKIARLGRPTAEARRERGGDSRVDPELRLRRARRGAGGGGSRASEGTRRAEGRARVMSARLRVIEGGTSRPPLPASGDTRLRRASKEYTPAACRALVAEMKGLEGGTPSPFFYPGDVDAHGRRFRSSGAGWSVSDYKSWKVLVQSLPRGERWSLWVQMAFGHRGYFQILDLSFEDSRTFPTQARAHEIGGMLGRAWIALSGRPVAALCREYAQMMKKVRA
jgi:hypothetical protein